MLLHGWCCMDGAAWIQSVFILAEGELLTNISACARSHFGVRILEGSDPLMHPQIAVNPSSRVRDISMRKSSTVLPLRFTPFMCSSQPRRRHLVCNALPHRVFLCLVGIQPNTNCHLRLQLLPQDCCFSCRLPCCFSDACWLTDSLAHSLC